MQEALQNRSEPSVFLDVILPRANERKRILVDSGQQLCLCLVDKLQTLCPLGHSYQTLGWNGAWHRQLVASTQSLACLHPLRLVETCQAASQRLCIYLKEC